MCRCSCVGPDNWQRISASIIAWAHRSAQKLMPVLLCMPMQLPNKICQRSCMGPKSCLQILQVLLCGPRQLVKNFCTYLCMGPQHCPKPYARDPVRAQGKYQRATTKGDLPMVLC